MSEEPHKKILDRTVAPAALMLFGMGGLAAAAAVAELALPLLIVGGVVAGVAVLNRPHPPR
ncbi:MAG: hypothetical protein WD490_11240 [Opitutales bacterium]